MSRLPRVLDNELKEVKRLHPSQLSLSQPEDGFDTATMIIPEEEDFPVRAFVELYRNDESMGIFRASSVGEVYGDSVEISLVHALRTLEDDVLVGKGELPKNAKAAISMLIDAQTVKRWRIGVLECDEEISEPFEYNNTNVWDGVKTILTYIPAYRIETDQSSYPWTLNVLRKPTSVSCEGRLSRNIASLRVTRDDSELCTRLYLDGDTKYWDADTIGEWGIISRTISTGSDLGENASEEVIAEYLDRKVAEYFEAHKNPTLSIEVEARDLKSATGYNFDHFKRGALCRLALPKYTKAFVERIVNIEYPDLLNDPDYALLQLSNRTDDASTRIAGLMVSVTRVEQTVKKTVDTLFGTKAGLNAYYDEFLFDGKNWMHKIHEVVASLDAVEATLLLKASSKELTATTERLASAEILLDGLNGEVALKVDKNGVVAAINVTTEEVKIDAAKINLSGYVTASSLSTEIASIKSGILQEVITSKLSASTVSCSSLVVTDASFRPKTLKYTDADGKSATMVVLAS